MKKIILVSLLFGVPICAAEEVGSWSCEGVSSIGFLWQNGSWQNQAYTPANYLLTIGSEGNASLIFSGYQWAFRDCVGDNIIRCSTDVGNVIVLNRNTGNGAVSSIVAAAAAPEDEEATTFMERVQCNKVER